MPEIAKKTIMIQVPVLKDSKFTGDVEFPEWSEITWDGPIGWITAKLKVIKPITVEGIAGKRIQLIGGKIVQFFPIPKTGADEEDVMMWDTAAKQWSINQPIVWVLDMISRGEWKVLDE